MTIPPPPAPPVPAAPVAPHSPAPRRGRWRAAAPWALSIALVVAAWGLLQIKQPEDAPYRSFVTTAQVGEQGVTRNLAVTVTDVHAARSVTDGDRWRAEGTWVVVDFDASATEDQFGALLAVSDLRIGERTYSATERGESAQRMTLITGVPQHGSIAFELPEGALRGPATLVFAGEDDYAADGVIEVPVDLGALPVEAEVELDPIGWPR